MERSPTEHAEVKPSKQDFGLWQRLCRWLEVVVSYSGQRGEDGEILPGSIADEVPEFLELGGWPPHGGDPSLWGPDVDGPLLEDKDYQRALKLLDDMELPSETIARRNRY